jgi:hypothetical protein
MAFSYDRRPFGWGSSKASKSILMEKNRIISIISDLKDFAKYNGLPQLAEHLEDAAVVGLMELDFETDRGSVLGGLFVTLPL